MIRPHWVIAGYVAMLFLAVLAGGLAVSPPAVPLWTGPLRFDAVSAHRYAAGLAEGFPYRPTGSAGSAAAARWLAAQFSSLGLQTGVQQEKALLDGRRVPLVNVYAVSPGRGRGTIIIVANHDMAPTSFQAASDTAAGVGVLLELARSFAGEPHEKTLVFLAPDGEEWGMLGARRFALSSRVPGPIEAAIVVEDLDIGRLRRVIPTMTGQFRGYTPLWLRELGRRATQAEGVVFADPPPALEYADRAVLIPATDQGPFLAAGIPSIELTTTGDQPELSNRIYHAPGDVMGLLRTDAFHAFGRIVERMVRALDTGLVPDAPPERAYIRLPDGRIISGWRLLLPQAGIFIPLLVAAAAALPRGHWLPAVGETLRRCLILAGAYYAVRLLPGLGLLPAYELYPPPPKHPLLYNPDWLPFLVPLLMIVLLTLVAGRLRLPPVASAGERYAGALAALTALAAVSFVQNPFSATTFLALPVWFWIWVVPGGVLRKAVNTSLLVGGWAVVAVLIHVQTEILFGASLPWYFLMGTAYGQFAAGKWLPMLALIAIWTQMLQVALARPARTP